MMLLSIALSFIIIFSFIFMINAHSPPKLLNPFDITDSRPKCSSDLQIANVEKRFNPFDMIERDEYRKTPLAQSNNDSNIILLVPLEQISSLDNSFNIQRKNNSSSYRINSETVTPQSVSTTNSMASSLMRNEPLIIQVVIRKIVLQV